MLEQTPNWERIKDLVGCPVPAPGTPELAAVKRELEAAGYQLDVLREARQPFRPRRLGDKTEAAPLTVTPRGVIALRSNGTNRISVPARYKKNHLQQVRERGGESAMAAASSRLQGGGHQIHHLIPDSVAQRHKLVREALRRVDNYTIDRGSNLMGMPSSVRQAEEHIIHRGSHPEYDKYVWEKLDEALDALTRKRTPLEQVSPRMLDDALRKVEDTLRKVIETGTLPQGILKELKDEGILPGRRLGLLLNGEPEESCV